MAAIAPHHREIFVLAAAVEAEPQTEAVRQRNLLLDRFAGIDRGRAFVLDHVARQQMPAVRGGVEDDVVGPALDAAFQHRLQRFVGGVVAVEGEVVAEHDEADTRSRAAASIRPGRLSISSRWISISFSRSAGLRVGVDAGMRGLDQRGLAHAARAPQQRVVGGQAVGEALGILDQDVAHPVDALEQAEIDPVDARHRRQPPVRVPDEGVGGAEGIGRRRPARPPTGAPAMASSASAIRSAVPSFGGAAAGRFVAALCGLRAGGLGLARALFSGVFCDICRGS